MRKLTILLILLLSLTFLSCEADVHIETESKIVEEKETTELKTAIIKAPVFRSIFKDSYNK